jgi:hypothetical protein
MPAPTATVVFVDAEGDEFPYSIGEQGYDETCERVARELLDRDIAAGMARPTLPVVVDRIERN